MNKFKNMKVRRKLIISFLLISLVSSLGIYFGYRIAIQNITGDALPTLQTVDQTNQLIAEIQRESIEYFASSQEPEQLEQLKKDIEMLSTTLISLRTISDDEDEVQPFNDLADLASEGGTLALGIAESQTNTRAKIAALQENIVNNELVFSQIREHVDGEIAESIESGTSDQLYAHALPTKDAAARLEDNIHLMELSLQNFILTGNDEDLQAYEAAQKSAEAALTQLEENLQEGEADEAELLASLAVLVQDINLLGRETLSSHINTLSLLKEMEDLETQLGAKKAIVAGFAVRDLNQALASAQTSILITSILSLFLALVLALIMAQVIANPIVKLTAVAEKISLGDLISQANEDSTDEIGTLGHTFNNMTRQLRGLVGNLEQRVDDRTRDLVLANEVGRSVSEIRDTNQLLADAVKIIQAEFNLYLAQIYMVEVNQATILLRAAEGQAAARLLEQGHFLAINTASINGTAVYEKRAVVVSNTSENIQFRPNPLLPDTRSEMAVPLMVRNKAIGVLDLQSNVANTFTEENVPAFTTMASQLAIALENATLFSTNEKTSADMKRILAGTTLQAQRLAALNNLGAALAAATRLEDVYQIAGTHILAIIEGDLASLTFITAAGNMAEVWALHDEKKAMPTGTFLPVTGTAVGLAIQENRIIQLPKEAPMSAYTDSRQLAQQGLQSILIMPLSISGQVIGEQIMGTLNIGSTQPYAFAETDMTLVQQAATLLTTTIDSLRLAERVQGLAAIVENHPDFIGTGTMDGTAVYINRAGLTLLGLPTDYDVSTLGTADFYEPEDVENLLEVGLPIALKTGFWTGEAQLRKADGTTTPVEQTIAINYDAQNTPTGFSITMHDIAERQKQAEAQRKLTSQLEERLLQVNSLQRAMTHEGWSAFLTSDKRMVQGYKFSNEQINLISRRDVERGNVPSVTNTIRETGTLPDLSTVAVPVAVRGETIGVIGARNPDGTSLNEHQLAMLNSLTQQVAGALDRARLFEEMEMAREQMNRLYTGSERVVRANSIEEVLVALVESTELKQMDTANLIFFNKPWAETPPDTLTITALWQKTPGITPEHVGDSYEMARFPSFLNMNRDKPTLYLDVKNTEHLEADVKMMSEYLGMNCVLYNPLIVSNQWIGILSAKAKNSIHLADEELKQISSLADQAASIAQNQHVFAQTQARARHEQLLREVGAKVYAAPNAENILKTAAQEINRIMGVDAFVYLDDPSTTQTLPANGHPLETPEPINQEG